MSSQLLRSLSRLLERERGRERAHKGEGVSDGAMERENEKDGEIVKLIRQSLCGGRISMSLSLSSSLSCYLLELSCQGSPCERLSQQAGHRAAREEKMKPASWREVRETASNTLSLSLKTSGVACSLICPSNISTQEARDCRQSAKTKENMTFF